MYKYELTILIKICKHSFTMIFIEICILLSNNKSKTPSIFLASITNMINKYCINNYFFLFI